MLLTMALLSTVPAQAAELPRFDVKDHCAMLTTDRQRWVRCMGNENEARSWLASRKIDARIIKDCWSGIRPRGGYRELRACVEARLR
jgi:hypothetical protein